MERLSILSLSVLVVACSDTPTEVPAQQAPSFGVTDAPTVSGIVMRGEQLVGITWTDEEKGWRTWIGGDIVAFCRGQQYLNGISVIQDVRVLDDRILTQLQGEGVQTTVWAYLGLANSVGCVHYLNEDPIAHGTSELLYTDNGNLFQEGRRHELVWGWRAYGVLATPEAGTARFSGHNHLHLTPERVISSRSEITLVETPTPTP